MTVLEDFRQLMQDFAQQIGLEQPPIAETGLSCKLVVNEQDAIVTIACDEVENRLVIFSALEPLSSSSASVYRHLLTANLFGQGTNGTCVGLDSNGDVLIIFLYLDLTVASTEALQGKIDQLLQAASQVKEQLLALLSQESELTTTSSWTKL